MKNIIVFTLVLFVSFATHGQKGKTIIDKGKRLKVILYSDDSIDLIFRTKQGYDAFEYTNTDIITHNFTDKETAISVFNDIQTTIINEWTLKNGEFRLEPKGYNKAKITVNGHWFIINRNEVTKILKTLKSVE